ncbi:MULTISPECIES: nuclear transport factor 2 family protein [Croceitalea]|uniref:Nuclear transport factor 2 family protein n=1 Tax=Croceitalea vernalis TaxID=3075599 RepID=A0ABU3BHL6_9FLAO|nr:MULTISPECIES: nuclear transport factor 2 family protein [unclassified Croceitalea]MDT0539850.1 nuclear transport factor 2 family protein [Croceitalea sp. P059]MDT0621667.1 nuclear transport factor 2 family protein [Croceitalea sp. P007]
MKSLSNKELCIFYLKKYAKKDINGVAALFDDTIVLRDWKISVVGKDEALKETQKNFNNVDSITIEVLSMYESSNTIVAELKITIDKKEELYVVDVISFNSSSKIVSIRAYLGRGD